MTTRDWDDLKVDRANIAPGDLELYDRYEALIDRAKELDEDHSTPLLVLQFERLMQELDRVYKQLVGNVLPFPGTRGVKK